MAAVNFLSSSSNPYLAFAATSKLVAPAADPRTAASPAAPATASTTTDRVTISQAARDALAAEAAAKANKPTPVEAKLNEIQAKSPMVRTQNDVNYVQLHAPKMAESMTREQKALPPV